MLSFEGSFGTGEEPKAAYGDGLTQLLRSLYVSSR
jgi:hypothetical protein